MHGLLQHVLVIQFYVAYWWVQYVYLVKKGQLFPPSCNYDLIYLLDEFIVIVIDPYRKKMIWKNTSIPFFKKVESHIKFGWLLDNKFWFSW